GTVWEEDGGSAAVVVWGAGTAWSGAGPLVGAVAGRGAAPPVAALPVLPAVVSAVVVSARPAAAAVGAGFSPALTTSASTGRASFHRRYESRPPCQAAWPTRPAAPHTLHAP